MNPYLNCHATRCFISRAVIAMLAVLVVLAGTTDVLFAQDGDRFDYSVAVSGDYAVVGAEWEEGFKGAAYLLRKDGDTWVVEQRLSPTGLGRHDHFGGSVTIERDVIIVGAAWHDVFRGAVWVFKRIDGEWVEREKLTASDAAPDQQFGRSVNLSGGVLTIGSGRGGDQSVAVAYEFERAQDRWVEGRRLDRSPAELRAMASEVLRRKEHRLERCSRNNRRSLKTTVSHRRLLRTRWRRWRRTGSKPPAASCPHRKTASISPGGLSDRAGCDHLQGAYATA